MCFDRLTSSHHHNDRMNSCRCISYLAKVRTDISKNAPNFVIGVGTAKGSKRTGIRDSRITEAQPRIRTPSGSLTATAVHHEACINLPQHLTFFIYYR